MSRVEGKKSRVEGKKSRVKCRGSRVKCRGSLFSPPCPPLAPPLSKGLFRCDLQPLKEVNKLLLWLTQPKTPQTCCKLWILSACCKLSTSSKSVDFIELQPVCENQTCCKLLKQLSSNLWIKSLDNQLASSLLITCSRLVIIKPEQAMRTHPDIDLMTVRQQACSRLAPTCAFF